MGVSDGLELFDLLVLARVVVHLKVELAEHLVLPSFGRHDHLLGLVELDGDERTVLGPRVVCEWRRGAMRKPFKNALSARQTSGAGDEAEYERFLGPR